MLKDRVGALGKHLESLVAIASFGGSSVYWLTLAFAMSPAAYGSMMTLQAAVLVVTTIFTLRTHDLVFNLVMRHPHSIGTAFRSARKSDLLSAVAGTLVCSIGAFLIYPPAEAPTTALSIAIFALLASIGANQGSSIAKLRYFIRGDIIAATDLLCATAWGVACISILLLDDHPPLTMLTIGVIPSALRSVALIAAASTLALPIQSSGTGPPAEAGVGRRTILRFLAGSQITNFLKNGAVPIETIILAAFASPATVAMYRVARAIQGASAAAMNVTYQRSYSALAKAKSKSDRLSLVRKLQKSSVSICVFMYPLSALIALGYALLKPDIGIIELQLITAGTFLALLAAAYQQGAFAILSLAGDHRSAGSAFILSFAFLGGCALLLFLWPKIEVFMIGIIGAAFVRAWFMTVRSRKAFRIKPIS